MKYIKVFISSLVIWLVLSTVKNHEAFPITNQNILLVIAHPDDEVMFFTPTITKLLQPNLQNNLTLVCFSNGTHDNVQTRSQELRKSAEILGLQELILHDRFIDNPKLEWEARLISTELATIVGPDKVTIVTFDDFGVSGHLNHVSLYYGCKLYTQESGFPMWSLKSSSILDKYSSVFVTNLRMVHESLLPNLKSISVFGNGKSVSKGFSSMIHAHKSQMVWFRWLWLFFSRYLNYNELERVD